MLATKYYLHRRRRNYKLVSVLALLRVKSTIRTRNYLSKSSLINPSDSAWHKLYEHGDEKSLINMVSLDRASFDLLLSKFSMYYTHNWRVGCRGRPPTLIQKHAVLGCLLVYYSDSMSLKNLCFAFGVPPATMSRMLHKAQTALLKTFRNHFPYARSKWPTKEEQEYFANLVSAQYPLIKGRWGFIDGKNYKVQKPSSADLQNAMYNGLAACYSCHWLFLF